MLSQFIISFTLPEEPRDFNLLIDLSVGDNRIWANALIFGSYNRSVSRSLIEAARVDGAGVWKVHWKIILPISPPAFVVAAIFQFTNTWNDFLSGVTIVPNLQSQPITVALNNLSGNFSVDWNVVMAGAVIAALPTAVLYVVLGRYFVRGLVSGSVKA